MWRYRLRSYRYVHTYILLHKNYLSTYTQCTTPISSKTSNQRLLLQGDPITTALCHCTDCQKWTGAAYTSNIVVPRSSLTLTQGTPKEYAIKGDSGKLNNHFFCGNCGSSLYTQLEIMPDVTCVKSGGLDGGANDHDIAVEFYTKDRMGYSKAIDGVMQKNAFESDQGWRLFLGNSGTGES